MTKTTHAADVDDHTNQLENELKDALRYVRVLESENLLLKKITHARMLNQQESLSTLQTHVEHIHVLTTENTVLKEEAVARHKYASSLEIELTINTLDEINVGVRGRHVL